MEWRFKAKRQRARARTDQEIRPGTRRAALEMDLEPFDRDHGVQAARAEPFEVEGDVLEAERAERRDQLGADLGARPGAGSSSIGTSIRARSPLW